MTEIKLENITKSYGKGAKTTEVLKDIDITIQPGEFFFLLGPSGCGKTTLLRCIAGLIGPSSGRILFNDENVTELEVEKRNCAMVFQNYALWPHMTVRQNVEFGPRMQKVDAKQRYDIALEKLDLVQMAEYVKRKPNQLSGGQQQRVALARALAARPRCLLLDEPLSNLDAKLRMQMRTELRSLIKSTGTTAIYVTHDQKEALSMADKIAILHNGNLEQVGTAKEVYNKPATKFVADFVGEANFIEGTVTNVDAATQIKTPIGEIVSSHAAGLQTGQNVLCCVRPENIFAATEKLENPHRFNQFTVKMENLTYLGEISQANFSIKENLSWKLTALGGIEHVVDDQGRSTIYIDPENVIVIPNGR